MRKLKLFCFLASCCIGVSASAQLHYVCYYTAEKPVIDGSGQDPVWQKASWTEDFTDIEGDLRPRPTYRTRTKMLWDKENLYIYAELEEPDLWGTLRQHDTIIYDDNDFEVFINPTNDTHNYFELEFNALNTEMDLFLPKPYRNGGFALLSWDAQGLVSAVQTKGTMNRPGDTDSGWSVEMAIPLKSLGFWDDKRLPGDGSQWRINFSRVEWDRDVVDGQYVPRLRPGGKRRLPEHNWVWSPQGIIDMHAPEKWGYLQFSAHSGGGDTVAYVPPADEALRAVLWKVYYAQKGYWRKHGRYAATLKELGVEAPELWMKATDLQFTAGTGAGLNIDQDGKVARAGAER
jgi:hypothetical protein